MRNILSALAVASVLALSGCAEMDNATPVTLTADTGSAVTGQWNGRWRSTIGWNNSGPASLKLQEVGPGQFRANITITDLGSTTYQLPKNGSFQGIINGSGQLVIGRELALLSRVGDEFRLFIDHDDPRGTLKFRFYRSGLDL